MAVGVAVDVLKGQCGCGCGCGCGGLSHHEKPRISNPPGRGYDLPSSAMQRLLRDHRIQDLELHIANSCSGYVQTPSYSTSLHIPAHHSTSLHITAHHCILQHITAYYNTSLHITAHHCILQHITTLHSISHHITAHYKYVYWRIMVYPCKGSIYHMPITC